MLRPVVTPLLRLGAAAVRLGFDRTAGAPAEAQERVRRRLVAAMARTAYGRACGVVPGMSYPAFAARVPIVEYEALASWVARQMETRAPVLAPGPVVTYEETSGSSGRTKYVPCTRALLDAFNGAFVLWAADLVVDGPRLDTGRAFFSISPAVRETVTAPSGVPVGLSDDTQYLTPVLRRLVRPLLVVPPARSLRLRLDDYRLVLACRLLTAGDLEIISIWSPTYLLALMDLVQRRRDEIAAAAAAGRVATAGATWPLPARPGLAALLRDGEIDWTRIWPRLAVLSCWADGSSGPYAARLASRVPGRLFQGKGLLATEAPITIPLVRADAPVPLVGHVFLEFERPDGSVARVHQLDAGEEVGVVVSQAGGFLRYRMGDRVRVAGRYGRTPCLRFLGRDSVVSDLVGEKLNEAFVQSVLARVLGPETGGVLVPVADPAAPAYVCAVERLLEGDGAVARRLEAELCQAFQYRQARLLGQLDPVRVVTVAGLRERVERLWLGRSMKWGDIKQVALLSRVTDAEVSDLLSCPPVRPSVRPAT